MQEYKEHLLGEVLSVANSQGLLGLALQLQLPYPSNVPVWHDVSIPPAYSSWVERVSFSLPLTKIGSAYGKEDLKFRVVFRTLLEMNLTCSVNFLWYSVAGAYAPDDQFPALMDLILLHGEVIKWALPVAPSPLVLVGGPNHGDTRPAGNGSLMCLSTIGFEFSKNGADAPSAESAYTTRYDPQVVKYCEGMTEEAAVKGTTYQVVRLYLHTSVPVNEGAKMLGGLLSEDWRLRTLPEYQRLWIDRVRGY